MKHPAETEPFDPKSPRDRGRWSSFLNRRRARFYISFSLKGPPDARGRWPRGAWPVLFHREEDAWEAIRLLPVFANAKQHGIKSCTVQRVRR